MKKETVFTGFASNLEGDGMMAPVDGKNQRGNGDFSDWSKKSHFHKVDPTLADLSIQDILERAELGFNAIKTPAYIFNPFTQAYEPAGDFHIYKDNFEGGKLTDKTVGEGYTIVQHAEALESILGDLRQLGGVPTRALSVNGGARALIQLQLPDEYYVKDSAHKLFINIWNDHSGKGGVGGNSVDFRAICQNTFAKAWSSAVMRFFAKHTKNVGERLAKLADAVGIIRAEYADYTGTLNLWANQVVTPAEIDLFAHAIIPTPAKQAAQRENNGPEKRRNDLAVKVVSGIGQSPVPTVYSLFNAVTESVDYRIQNRDETGQLAYALFGSGASLKDEAYAWLADRYGEVRK